ncbi:MAG TPA: NAD(P)-dependent alcohol dehydrogenase [Gammaproteobacteria bacterium]|jgi:NADPH:quinone reductase-like Zn-dependent oxidoreductase|nr:NAD(P)-dependent alcohol dehydrogenase [Gammaproteobacteria bacterium]
MKAIIHRAYGPADKVLELGELDVPTARNDEVLVRVRAASVHPDVWHVLEGLPYVVRLFGNGVVKPKKLVPGTDLAGVVEAVGENATRFKVGDEVFGESTPMAWYNGGAYAEYAAVPEKFLVHKPVNISFEEAAAVPTSGFIALSNLRRLELNGPGQNVLINGAGGCVGTLAIQIAKARGARVTAVDRADKLEMMRALGADRVVDYTKEDVLRSSDRYDLILDVASNLSPDTCKPVLAERGDYVQIGHAHFGKASGRNGGRIVGSLPYFVWLLFRTMLDPEKRKNFKIPDRQEIMLKFKALIESGQLKPLIGRTFTLAEVPEAMRCMQAERVVGRIIVTP